MARLIIVEDNHELAFLIVSATRARGHQSTAVGTGRAALQALKGGATFDAALVDLLLPDMGGGEVLSALRDAGVPAVAMSGVYRGEEHARNATEQHGAARFFEKPFDMRELLKAVEEVAAEGGVQPAVLIDDEEDDELAELEVLTSLEEEDEGDEPLVAAAPVPELGAEPGTPAILIDEVVEPEDEPPTRQVQAPVPELDDEPGTPTRPFDEAELAVLAQISEPTAAPPVTPVSVAPAVDDAPEVEEEIPTRVTGPPLEFKRPESILASVEEEVADALEALEAMAAPMSVVEAAAAAEAKATPPPPPPPAPRPARGPGGAVGMAHELAVRVSHRPPEKVVVAQEAPAIETPAPPPPPTETPPPETPVPDAVLVPFGERGRVWSQPDHPSKKRPLPDWGEAGDLGQSSVPRLLNAFYEARHTGELKLKQDSVLKVVTIEHGLPVYAASNLATERFGRFCVRRGAITEDDLNRVAALAELEGIRTGESMVRLGLLTSDRRRELLEEQVREIIWSTFGWNRGQYHLVPKKPSRQDLVKLFLFPGELILEGVARTYTLIALRQKMPAGRRLFAALDPPYLQQDIPLTGPQAALLAAADGSKTVEDLMAITDLSEREALASLLGFELLGLLVERRLEEGKRQRISFGL